MPRTVSPAPGPLRKRRPNGAPNWRAASACLLLIAPVPVLQPEDDGTGETSLTIGAGSSAYEREIRFQSGVGSCGPITRRALFNSEITDVGADLEHHTGKHGRIGLRAGLVREKAELLPGQVDAATVDSLSGSHGDVQDNFYLNPYVAAEGTFVGGGLGIIVASDPLRLGDTEKYPTSGTGFAISGHVRVGKRSILYASASSGESVPIYSGGGFFNYGVGVDLPVGPELWVGKALGPWREDEILVKAGINASRRWSVGASLRLEGDAPQPSPDSRREYGLGFHVTRRFVPR